MCRVVGMEVGKTFRHIQYLGIIVISRPILTEKGPTKSIRFALGFLRRYSVRIPFGIHSDTSRKRFRVAPMKATMFGCLSLFHISASLQNAYAPTDINESEQHVMTQNTNLFNGLAILLGDPQSFYTDFGAVVDTFPDIGGAAGGDGVGFGPGKIAGNSI